MSPLIVELEEDWDAAVEQWDQSLHLEDSGNRAITAEPLVSLPFPYSGKDQFDEEADPLPPLPDAPALPDFQQRSSVPATLIRELQAAPQLDQEPEGSGSGEISETELPEPPSPEVPLRERRSAPPQPSAGSAKAGVESGQPSGAPSPDREARSAAPSIEDQVPREVEVEVSAGPLPLPPTPPGEQAAQADGRKRPEAEELEAADGAPPIIEEGEEAPGLADLVIMAAPMPPPPARPILMDEDFYEVIAIEQREAAPESMATPLVRADSSVRAREEADDLFAGQFADEEHGGDFDRDRTPRPGETTFPGERIADSARTTILIEADLPPGSETPQRGSAPTVQAPPASGATPTPVPTADAAPETATPSLAATLAAGAAAAPAAPVMITMAITAPLAVRPTGAPPATAQPEAAPGPATPEAIQPAKSAGTPIQLPSDDPLALALAFSQVPASRRTPAIPPSALSPRLGARGEHSSGTMPVPPVPPEPSVKIPVPEPLAARRLPLPALEPLGQQVGATHPARPLTKEVRRGFLTLLDAEMQAHLDPARRAALALSAAHHAEVLGDAAAAADRYRRVLAAEPRCRPALRGLRRLSSRPGSADRTEAVTLLGSELEQAAPAERAGILLQRGDLLLLLGQPQQARASYEAALSAGATLAAWTGLHDAATSAGDAVLRSQALSALSADPATAQDPRLRAAFQIEQARIDETAAQDPRAATRYQELLDQQVPGSTLLAALGLLRVGLRLQSAPAADAPDTVLANAHRVLATTVSAPAFQASLLRRVGLLPTTDKDQRLAALQQAVDKGDTLALGDLAEQQEQAGLFAEAAQTYRRLADGQAGAAAAHPLAQAGEMHERAGQLEEARQALEQALALEGTQEYDALTQRALERVLRRMKDTAGLLHLARRESPLQPDRAAYAHVLSARLLLSRQPQIDAARTEALAELHAALSLRPGYPPALTLLRDLLVQDRDPEQSVTAARLLLAAAPPQPAAHKDTPSDAALRLFYHEDAARLLGRAGHIAEAAKLLLGAPPETLPPSAQAALRWQLERLLGRRVELTPEAEPELAQTLAQVLRTEAEQSPDPQRAADLWFRRGLLLAPLHPLLGAQDSPVEDSLRKALAIEQAHGGAAAALAERILSARTAHIESPQVVANSPGLRLLIEHYRERLMAATGRPEAIMVLLRLSALQEHEQQDPAGALQSLNLLRSIAPGYPGAAGQEQVLISLARRAGDQNSMLELLERELQDERDDDLRFVLLLRIGEIYELHRQPRLAAGRYEEALELRHGHPVALTALSRAYERAGMYKEMRRLVDKELAAVQDVPGRVAAYERMLALAAVDPELRGSPQAAIETYEAILNVDANHHMAMRVLERHYIAERDFGSLIHLYEQMGLTATDTAFAVQIHLDRARLRQRLAWQSEARHEQGQAELVNYLENDFRLALYRDPHSRPALRHVLTTALRVHDLNQVAELSSRLAEVCDQSGSGRGEAGDGRAAAVFLTRAAECYVALSRDEDAISAAYRVALDHNPQHLPSVRGLLRHALTHQRWSEVSDAAELLGAALHSEGLQYDSYLLAGAVAQEHLLDLERAVRDYRLAQRVDFQRPAAFDRLRRIFLGQAQLGLGNSALPITPEPHALAELYEEQLLMEIDPHRMVTLRVELAVLLRDTVGNRERAKDELREALRVEPNHSEALGMLGALHYEDHQWTDAAEVLLRRARVERRPTELAEIFLLLGQIYSEQLPEPRRAVASYVRALELQPDHQAALSQLSALYLVQQKPESALPLLRKLADLVPEKEQKVAYLHRVARLHEGLGEVREAMTALRQAVDLDPMYLPSIAELAHFFDRQSDVQSMRVHLDRAAARYRQLLRGHPDDVQAYAGLQQIFYWRRSTDQAALCAEVLHLLGGALTPEAQVLYHRLQNHEGYPGSALRDPGLDEILYPPSISPGFRALFSMLAETLGKLYRTDPKRLEQLGVQRRERLPRSGHPLRDLANRIAADLAVGEFEIYVTAAQGKDDSGRPQPYCTLEATDPPSLILSQSLLAGAGEGELRFFLGGLLKLLQSHLVLPLRLSADSLGTLVGGVVRMFVNDYLAIGIADRLIIAEAQRMQKAIPRKQQPQVLPIALECASTALDFATTEATLIRCQYQVGLLAAGSVASAQSALRRLGPAAEPYVMEILRFAVSNEFAEMRAMVGTNLT